tara:strand:- start:29536 stop:30972 length:1437 start_codon:yes stop_codon:yes gene_type:complete
MEIPQLKPVDLNGVKKKRILLLCDDMRVHSGIGTMARSIVNGTIDKYDWVQIGGAINHPDIGKVFDLDQEFRDKGIENPYCRIYPVNGYGDASMLRQIMAIEKPDAILHFTDPRFWEWLYDMGHEIRQTIPIMYYNIWDDLPYPHWNENAYESCDLLMAISKQTYNINNQVCQRRPRKDWDLTYVPHGIDEKEYHPVEPLDGKLLEVKEQFFGTDPIDFVAFFNSRNIQRKRPSDLIQGFKMFLDEIGPEKAERCGMIMHTTPIDQHGTDLPKVADVLAPNAKIKFSSAKISSKDLNILYNLADVTCQPSSAEGFGLSIMESLMAGTPVLASCIGGIQDQMGLIKSDGTPVSLKDYSADWPSNSDGKYKNHGMWVYPMWPQMNLAGSPTTPYIYDSRVSIKQIKDGLKYWYDMGKDFRNQAGLTGRQWATENGFTSKSMCASMINSIEGCFSNWKPLDKFTLINTNDIKKIEYPIGII